MILKCHHNIPLECGINTQRITAASRLVSSLMSMPVQFNKAIVGRNAFAHSSGIHQDGVLKNTQTYEIIDPKDVGLDESDIVLTARSGRAALKHRLGALGVKVDAVAMNRIYEAFLKLADKKKELTDDDILMLAGADLSAKKHVRLEALQVTTGKGVVPDATIRLSVDGQVFDMKDFESGVTAPPFHVYCRSVVAPYFPDDFGEIGQRAARDEVNDKTYYVPADMKYPEWKKAFVDGSTIKVQPVQKGGIIEHTKAFDDLLSVIKKDPCDYIEVEDLKTPLSEDEIIERLGGGDLTKGSCASLAYAYAGNKAGWDVLDFRGGNSQYHFSNGFTKDWILQFDNVKSIVSEDYDAIKNTYSVLNDIEKRKEYILGVGGHAAVIRKRDDGVVEYLELQSEKDKGWHSFTKDTLKNRFNAKRSRSVHGYKLMQKTTLIDVESLGESDDFRSILGYLNTSASKQKKGVGGYAK